MAFTTPTERKAKTSSDRARRHRAALSAIERRPVANMARRKRLERNPQAWLKYYLAAAFPLPWGKVHTDMTSAAVRAIRTGAGMVVAAPRGTGKSSVLWGLALWAILSGACRFPVVAGWAHNAARRMLRKWLMTLADNPRIAADYPGAVQPFQVAIHSNRLKALTWADTNKGCGADVRQMDGVIMLPDGLGALGAVSIGGNVRGLHAAMQDGSTIRPDVLLLDDPQDKVTASSAPLVRKVTERIEADLFNLSGPNTRLSVMAAVTVIASGDVAEHFLSHPDFEAVRVAQITSWPTDFADRSSPMRKRWESWNTERVEGLADHDEGKRARVFYKANKTALTAGATVSWRARFDRKRRDPDALYAAMWDYYRLGEVSFMSERQNKPMKENVTVYDLNAALICSRVHAGRNRFDVPAEARVITAATDLNHYGLHSAAIAFGNDQTGWVAWYDRFDNQGHGIVPKNCPEPEAKKRMFEALVLHGRQIAALPLTRTGKLIRVGLWLIDGGYMHDVVQSYVKGPGRTLGIPIAVCRGYSADRYRPTGKNVIGQAREGCHLTESQLGRFIAFNADYHREIAQRAWLGSVNAPGSLSLFDGARHSEFAEQICREKLLEKLSGQYGPIWRWATAPGWHDYLDALVMCYIGAVWGGIGTIGASAPPPRRQQFRRRVRHIAV